MGTVSGLRAYFRKAGATKAVIGLSGGIDSALACFLTARALGAKNVTAYYLPYFGNGEENYAKTAAKWAGVRLKKASIRKAVDAVCDATGTNDRVGRGNVMARVRMALLYAFARKNRALVVGTGNKSELLTGYFTKYGDGGCDVLPLGALYKTEVMALAKRLGAPTAILKRKPTAGLWKGQTDEGELGMSYAELDALLRKGGLRKRVSATEHKRKPPVVIKC
ncbi:putative NH(3)-dependent NAD(+) synthetase [Candidatus Norongarragalina meridionalis]|nr:putative NH(3)-dependent NAD(+) synthetase [Candidatus Norongarragalina meridionalis]